jgi:uncharacterized protein YvpB
MNNHLIKNHKYSTIKGFVIMLISYAVLVYFFDIEKYLLIFMAIFIGYSMFKTKKILLEIILNQNSILLHTYSIINGKKEICINLEQIIEIDFDDNLIISYKDEYGKSIETFEINAEPWNNLYSRIKELKLKHQEFEILKKEKTITE